MPISRDMAIFVLTTTTTTTTMMTRPITLPPCACARGKNRPACKVIIDDNTYNEIAVKTVLNCLARMTGCWDPEFESSEKIVEY